MTVILDPPKVDSAKTTSGVLAVARPCYTVNNVMCLRQKCSDGAANVRPADGAVAEFRRALVTGDQMSARKEDSVDVLVHADFTRLRLVKSTILLHQHLFLVICIRAQYIVYKQHKPSLFVLSTPTFQQNTKQGKSSNTK